MKCIETKYLPATDSRGARYKAFDCDGNSLTIPPNFYLDSEGQCRRVAEALRDKMGWTGELIGGGTKHGYCFVFKS